MKLLCKAIRKWSAALTSTHGHFNLVCQTEADYLDTAKA